MNSPRIFSCVSQMLGLFALYFLLGSVPLSVPLAAQSLTRLGTMQRVLSRAVGVSADGSVVVGMVETTAGQLRAFRWTAQTGMQDLGTLGGDESEAVGVSTDGKIVTEALENHNSTLAYSPNLTKECWISASVVYWYFCKDNDHYNDACVDRVSIEFTNSSDFAVSRITFILTITEEGTIKYRKRHTISVNLEPDETITYELTLAGRVYAYAGHDYTYFRDDIDIRHCK